MSRGDEFLLALPLPNEASGIEHSSFILSSDAANAVNGYCLVASSHRNAKPPFGFSVPQSAHRPEPGVTRPFDVARPIGVEQTQAVDPTLLRQRVGSLAADAFGGGAGQNGYDAHSAIRVQFALPGFIDDLRKLFGARTRDFTADSTAIRGTHDQFSIWHYRHGPDQGTCVIVSNDKHNRHADHVQVLQIGAPSGTEMSFPVTDQNQVTGPESQQPDAHVTGRMMLMLKTPHGSFASLQSRLGNMTAAGVTQVQRLLSDLFGL